MRNNEKLLYDALENAIADMDFMGDNDKVDKAIEALSNKGGVASVFKRLQGNALKDYLVNKDEGKAVDTPEAKVTWMRDYVFVKFKKHMTDPITGTRATKLFNDAYPQEQAPIEQEAI